MATYRRMLKDRKGNNIIPAMVSVETQDIKDKAVTSDKIKSVMLYESSTGSRTGTLSQDTENFRCIKAQIGKSIGTSSWVEAFVETDGTAGTTFCQSHIASFTQIFTGKASFWDTNFGIYDCRYNNFYGRNDFETGTSTEVKVYKIIGYI